MKVLVIIVTYNGIQWVERCLGSVRSSLVKADAFVVDNGSTDGTQDYIQQHFPNVIFKQSEENLGFGKANNLGLQYAIEKDYDYVYLLNQDAWIFPETIGKLISVFESYHEYGILSPFQMSADEYSLDGPFLSRLLFWSCNQSIVNDLYNRNLKEVYGVDRVMAAHWLISRKCIVSVGGFSPTFPHYGEDDNYSDRVKYKGFHIGVVPSLKVIHDRQWRVDDKKKKMYKLYINCLYLLSNPEKSSFRSFCGTLRTLLSSVIEYKSLVPIGYLCKICANIKSVIKNKRISMTTDCTFLKYTGNKLFK